MLPFYGFLVLIYHASTGLTTPATYDQRQTGDLNVQVHLKDVHVLALLDKELLDDYTEYDYFYDYDDFTIKPSEAPVKPTPISEISSTSSDTTTKPETEELTDSNQNSTLSLSTESSNLNYTDENITVVDSEKPNESLIKKPGNTISENVKTRNMLTYRNSGQQHSELSSQENSTKLMRKRCRSGYSPDGKGRCRRFNQRRLSLIPLAIKLGPTFLDDLTRNAKSQP